MVEEKEFTKKDMEMIMHKEDGITRYYGKIKAILGEWMDMEEEQFSLVALWIIGTYFHKQFSSYPYLFFNAMKGSGKSRVMNIISSLSRNGEMIGSLTDSVLFRTAENSTFCMDEFEDIDDKEKRTLRLLLNSAYKKGLKVKRMRKAKDGGQEVESFSVYCPITMANIWGMENVLADRCVLVTLEKSSKKKVTKRMENFENDINFQTTKGGLMRLTEKLQNDHKDFFKSGIFDNLISKWNDYIDVVNNVNNVNIVNEIDRTDDIYNFDNYKTLFSKIDKTNLSGRDLELFFPLFIIADMIAPEVLEELIGTAKKTVKLRKESDREENKDVKLIEFIAQSNYQGYVSSETIARDFSEHFGEEPKFNTSRSISRALNRLKLIDDKKSTGKIRLIKIDIPKAKEKLKLFKDPDPLDQFSDEEIKLSGWTREKLDEALK